MPSDTYILTISDSGVSIPSTHASSHLTGGSDAIPVASTSTSGLMSPTIFDQHVVNTAKVSNVTHTGDVTDTSGVLTVDKIKGVSLAGLGGGVLKVAATTGIPSIATAADYPTLNQSTTGNAQTATTATKATNIAGGATGSLPYQTANDSTSMLTAGASGTILKSNGAAAPSWSAVEKSMLSTALSNEITANTAKVSNVTHTGDVTDASGVLTVTKLNGTPLASFNATTATSATSATTATKSTNLIGGTAGSIPYQNTVDSTQMLSAGASGTVLKSNGAAPPSWSTVEKSMLSTALSNEITANTNKLGNLTHSGDVTDTGGVLKVTGVNNVLLSTLGTGILKNTTGTGVPSIAAAADFPTMTVPVGGTGITSYSIGDLLYASTNTTLDKLTSIAAGNVLTTNGTNNAPSYGKVALSGAVTHITGTLPVSSGGTGAISLSGYVKGTGTAALSASANVPVTDLSGTLPVSQGGTGAVTLNGYVKGTGTSALSADATVPVADISGTLLVNQGGTGTTTATGTGSVVLSSSPSLTTPNLGTPSEGILVSCTGLPIETGTTGTLSVGRGGTGTTSLNGYVKGTGTSALSASATIPITDLSGSFGVANGGTGQSTFTAGIVKSTGGTAALTTVGAPAGDLVGTTAIQTLTNKTLTAPDLGTPAGGILSSCTGLPLTTGVTGTLLATNGGTGYSSFAVGDLLYADTTTSLAKLVDVATGSVLLSGGLNNAPSYGKVDLTTHVTGILPLENGGTGQDLSDEGSGVVIKNGSDIIDIVSVLPKSYGGTGQSASTFGGCYLASSAATTFSFANVWTKVVGTTTFITGEGVDAGIASNQIRSLAYGNNVLISVTGSLTGSNTNVIKVGVFLDGGLVVGSPVQLTITGAGHLMTFSCQCYIPLFDYGSYIELFVQNTSSNNSVTFDSFNVFAHNLI